MLKKIFFHAFLMLLAFVILLPIIWMVLASFTESTHAAYVVERIFKPDYVRSSMQGNQLTLKYKISQLDMKGTKTFNFGKELAGKYITVEVKTIETLNKKEGYSTKSQELGYTVYDSKPDHWLAAFFLGSIGQLPDDGDVTFNQSLGYKLSHRFFTFNLASGEKSKGLFLSYKDGKTIRKYNFKFEQNNANRYALITFSRKTHAPEIHYSNEEFRPEFRLLTFRVDKQGNIAEPILQNNQLLVTYLNVLTLANYKGILWDKNFRNWLANSVIISLLTALLSVLLGFFAGYSFSRFKFPGRKISMLWVIATQLFPLAMMIVPFYILAAGVLPIAIPGLNIVNTRWGLVLIYSATALPFAIWMMKGYFDTIPVDLEEAAAIDGASLSQLLALILFPLARPAMFTAFLFAFVQSWNEYAIASMFMTKVEMLTLPVGLQTLMGGSGSTNQNIAWFAAGAVIVSVPVVLLFLSMKKELVESSTLGAIKG